MATNERQGDAGLTEGVVFLSDTGVKLTDVVHWEEEGAQYFRSAEFPFLIAAGDTLQEAANALVEGALDYLHEMHEIGLGEVTEAEQEATFALYGRLKEAYEAMEAERKRRLISINLGRLRRRTRGITTGIWRPSSPGNQERSGRLSHA